MDVNLLRKYYDGNCTSEEVAQVQQWFESENKDAIMRQLAAYWNEYKNSSPFDHDSNQILKNIHARIQHEEPDQNPSDLPSKSDIRPKNSYFWIRIAAIIVLALGVSWQYHRMFPPKTIPEPQISVIEKKAYKGQRLTVTLGDGSKVILNAESKLSYPSQFSQFRREVTLEGEAFFEVEKDSKRPFIINCHDIKTTVLGTSFNIKAYQADSSVSVAVATGKVKVNKPTDFDKTYYLYPGKELLYKHNENSFKISEYDSLELLAWKDDVLILHHASMREVKKKLERWYGVDIQIQGNYKDDWQYSGEFRKQSLENVLMGLSYVQHFDFKLEDKNVTITF